MNAVTSTWRQLVRRKLWPLAVLLVAALVAVPVVLAREAEVPVVPPSAVAIETSKAGDEIAEPVVAAVAPEDRSRRRRVLGKAKDPFKPTPPKKVKAATVEEKPETTTAPKVETGSSGSGGTIAEPAPEKTYYSAGTIIVRFGEASETADLERLALHKLEPLPDDEFPLLVYMGLTKNGKKAKFMVDAAIEADGDAVCRPHASMCETIELAVGETEFLDVVDPEYDEATMPEEQKYLAHWQLDLVDIKRAGDSDVR